MKITKEERRILEYLFEEVDNCVKSSVDISSLGLKHILLVKSANDDVFDAFMTELIDMVPKISVSIIGEFKNKSIFKKYEENIDTLVFNGGRFVKGLFDRISLCINGSYDAIVFMNYSRHRESYLNVEEFCMELESGLRKKVFGYIIEDKEFIKYSDIKQHIYSMRAYCNYLYMLDSKAKTMGGLYWRECLERYKEKKDVIVFGAGNWGRSLASALINNEISSFRGFCDNKSSTDTIDGLPVMKLDEAMNKYPQGYYVVTPKYEYNKIMRQLLGEGVGQDKIEVFNYIAADL